jgi:hypothetical protein
MNLPGATLLFLAAGATNMDKPLQLVTREDAAGVHVAVQGLSQLDCRVQYELHIESGPQGGMNRSVQRGRAQLVPGQKLVVAKVTLGPGPGNEWKARLVVQDCRGEQYELLRSGPG